MGIYDFNRVKPTKLCWTAMYRKQNKKFCLPAIVGLSMVSNRRLIGGRKSIPESAALSHNIQRPSRDDNGSQLQVPFDMQPSNLGGQTNIGRVRSYTGLGPALEDDIELQNRVEEQSQDDVLVENEIVERATVPEVGRITNGEVVNRTKLLPLGDSFENKTEVLKIIHTNIHSHFTGPWHCFSKVPASALTLWWEEFEKHFFWDKWDGPLIKANWRSKCSAHIRNAFADARKRNIRPKWVSPQNWATMMKHWKYDAKFKRYSTVNKKNRTSESSDGTAIYAGGSKSVAQVKKEFKEANGRDMNTEELMHTTYHSKRLGKWMGDRPKKCLDRFNALRTIFLESHSEISKEDEEMLWLQAVGGEKKGRVYGQGSSYRKWDYVLNPPPEDPSPTTDHEPSLSPHVAPSARDPPPPPPTRVTPQLVGDPSLSARRVPPQLAIDLPVPARVVTPSTLNTESQMAELMKAMEARFQAQEKRNTALAQELRTYKEKVETMEIQRSHVLPQTQPSNTYFQALLGSDDLAPLMNDQGQPSSFPNYGGGRTSNDADSDGLDPY